MVLKLLNDDKICSPQISKFAKFNNGKWKFDAKGYLGYYLGPKLEKVYNDEYESILNGPDLFECNRCGIPDTKINLDNGVEHSRYQCEQASYYFKVYKKMSDDCRENPGGSVKCINESVKFARETKFQDNALYFKSKYAIRCEPHQWGFEFNIPKYNGDNMAPRDWSCKLYDARNKIRDAHKIHNEHKIHNIISWDEFYLLI